MLFDKPYWFADDVYHSIKKLHSTQFDIIEKDLFKSQKISKSFNLTTGYGFQANIFEKLSHDARLISFNNSKVKIYKLHGSINWFKYKGERKADIDNICIGPPYLDRYRNRIEELERFSREEWSIKSMFEKTPELVPMTYNKSVYLDKPIFDIIWSRAYQALIEADDIYFIGYSFPETDTNNTYFYKEFEDKIKGICVYEKPEALKKFKSRIKNYFPNLKISSVITNCDAVSYLKNL